MVSRGKQKPRNPLMRPMKQRDLHPDRSLGTRNLSGRIHESSPVLRVGRWDGEMWCLLMFGRMFGRMFGQMFGRMWRDEFFFFWQNFSLMTDECKCVEVSYTCSFQTTFERHTENPDVIGKTVGKPLGWRAPSCFTPRQGSRDPFLKGDWNPNFHTHVI